MLAANAALKTPKLVISRCCFVEYWALTNNILALCRCFCLRPSNTGNLSRNSVALQIEMVCCAYYHLLAQQIFMLQKVKVLQHKNLLRTVRNKPSQLATQHCCATSCTKNVARTTKPLNSLTQIQIRTAQSKSDVFVFQDDAWTNTSCVGAYSLSICFFSHSFLNPH